MKENIKKLWSLVALLTVGLLTAASLTACDDDDDDEPGDDGSEQTIVGEWVFLEDQDGDYYNIGSSENFWNFNKNGTGEYANPIDLTGESEEEIESYGWLPKYLVNGIGWTSVVFKWEVKGDRLSYTPTKLRYYSSGNYTKVTYEESFSRNYTYEYVIKFLSNNRIKLTEVWEGKVNEDYYYILKRK